MRGHIPRATKALSSVARPIPTRPALQSPYICSKCRASAKELRPIGWISRSYSTTSPSRQQPTDARSSPPRETNIPQTHYDFFPQTFPDGAPPKAAFTPDLRELRREFLQLQAKAHPDLAPAGQKRHAEALSMRINEAYKTLQDPLRRAQYLLAQQGIDVEDESAKLAENALLMEVMEAREAVDEVEDEAELGSLRDANNARIAGSIDVLDGAFARGDLDHAAQEAIRLRYWMNIEESIQGWEKGVGGGAVHH